MIQNVTNEFFNFFPGKHFFTRIRIACRDGASLTFWASPSRAQAIKARVELKQLEPELALNFKSAFRAHF